MKNDWRCDIIAILDYVSFQYVFSSCSYNYITNLFFSCEFPNGVLTVYFVIMFYRLCDCRWLLTHNTLSWVKFSYTQQNINTNNMNTRRIQNAEYLDDKKDFSEETLDE